MRIICGVISVNAAFFNYNALKAIGKNFSGAIGKGLGKLKSPAKPAAAPKPSEAVTPQEKPWVPSKHIQNFLAGTAAEHRAKSEAENKARSAAVAEGLRRNEEVRQRVHGPSSTPAFSQRDRSGIYRGAYSSRKAISGLIDRLGNFGKIMSPAAPSAIKKAQGFLAADKKGATQVYNKANAVAQAVPMKSEGKQSLRDDIAGLLRGFRKSNRGNPGVNTMMSRGYQHGALEKVKQNSKHVGM